MSDLYIYNFKGKKIIERRVVNDVLYGVDGFTLVDIQAEGYFNIPPIKIKQEHFDKLQKDIESGKHDGMHLRYWLQILSTTYNAEGLVIIDGKYFVDNKSESDSSFLGFGGKRFKYKLLGTDEIITTNNMWNGSEIDDLVLEFIPNNAEWAEEVIGNVQV